MFASSERARVAFRVGSRSRRVVAKATPWQPYLSNLCVTQRARRSGIGRALLALMEEVIRYVWKDQRRRGSKAVTERVTSEFGASK